MEGTEDGQHTVDRKTVGSTKKNVPKTLFRVGHSFSFWFGLEVSFNASGRICELSLGWF